MNARITPRVRDEYFRGGGGGRESPNNLSVGSYGKNYREIWGKGGEGDGQPPPTAGKGLAINPIEILRINISFAAG